MVIVSLQNSASEVSGTAPSALSFDNSRQPWILQAGLFARDAYALSSGNSSSPSSEGKFERLSVAMSTEKSDYWLGDQVKITGSVKNGIGNVSNFPIFLVLSDADGKQLIKTAVTTGATAKDNGTFTFTTPSVNVVGSLTVSALSEEDRAVPNAIVSVKVHNYISLIIIPILIASSFLLLLVGYKEDSFSWTVLAVIPVTIGYALYAVFPLGSDPFGEFAIPAALFVPLIGVVIDYIKKGQQARDDLKGSVSKYRDEHLKKEVDMLVRVYDEIAQHYTLFQSKVFSPGVQLQNKLATVATTTEEKGDEEAKDDGIRVGTMANLPGLRIHQYYRYVDDFNQILEAYTSRSGELKDESKWNEFKGKFDILRDEYARLESILYINLIYSIGEIQERFLSFPSVDFPTRYSWPLLFMLLKSGALGQYDPRDSETKKTVGGRPIQEFKFIEPGENHWFSENKAESGLLIARVQERGVKVYSEDIAYLLMSQIGKDFTEQFKRVEECIKEIKEKYELDSSPVAYAQSPVVVPSGGKKTIQLLASNSNGKSLTFSVKKRPTFGELSDPDKAGKVQYAPPPGFIGEDSFTFIVSDGIEESDPAKVTISVRADYGGDGS